MTRLIGKFAIASLVAAAFLFSLGLPSQAQAQAHPAHPAGQMQHAQQRERAQIQQGVKNGSLTKEQAKNLERHSKEMQSQIAADRADGKLTPQEAKQLKNETRKEEKAIKGAEDSNKATMPPTQQ